MSEDRQHLLWQVVTQIYCALLSSPGLSYAIELSLDYLSTGYMYKSYGIWPGHGARCSDHQLHSSIGKATSKLKGVSEGMLCRVWESPPLHWSHMVQHSPSVPKMWKDHTGTTSVLNLSIVTSCQGLDRNLETDSVTLKNLSPVWHLRTTPSLMWTWVRFQESWLKLSVSLRKRNQGYKPSK